MTNTQRTVSALKAIPREKLADKVRKTVAGLFLAGLGIVATWKFGAPWWVAVGSGLLGATVWSGELVVAPLKLLGAAVVDLWQRAKGGPPA